MDTYKKILAVLLLGIGSVGVAHAAPEIGKPAPTFTGQGSDGKVYSLADYKGKYVVLQWYNRDCPFIHKHYDGGNMQKLQDTYGKKGVIWLEVASSAPGKEGDLTVAQAQEDRSKSGTKSVATLMDPAAAIARLYQAKTTPHLFIIDPQGVLIYKGAIDDHATADAADIPNSKNYVAAALDEALAGKPVSTPSTKPYGCSVKYQ